MSRKTDLAIAHAAQAAAGGVVNLLGLTDSAFRGGLDPELDGVAEDFASALRETLNLKRKLNEDDTQLLGALDRWLP